MVTKKIIRVKAQRILRKTGLLSSVEQLRYYLKSWSYSKSNKQFIRENPGFTLPPARLAFDAYSAPAWNFYKHSGEGTAKFLAEMATKYFPGKTIGAIYEWGCGPGRVVRHLPAVVGDHVSVYGSDYNTETIEWCNKNIPGVQFSVNQLDPPLAYPANSFDLVYCISVFTHLSAATGLKWANELLRVLKPGGLLVLTTSGEETYKTELLNDEKKKFDEEGIMARGQYAEGKKMYLTWHNPHYVKKTLLAQMEILEHLPAGFPYIGQDCWIARKK